MGQWIGYEIKGELRSVCFVATEKRLRPGDEARFGMTTRAPSIWQRATLANICKVEDGWWSITLRTLAERITNGKRSTADRVTSLKRVDNLGSAKSNVILQLTKRGYIEPRTQRAIDDPFVEYTIDGVDVRYTEVGLQAAYGLSSLVCQQRRELRDELAALTEPRQTMDARSRRIKAARALKKAGLALEVDNPPFTSVDDTRVVSVPALKRAMAQDELLWVGDECFRLMEFRSEGSTFVNLYRERVGYRKGLNVYPQRQSENGQKSGTLLIACRPLERYYEADELCWTGLGTFRLANDARPGATLVLADIGEDPALRSLTPEDRAAAEERLNARPNKAFTPSELDWWSARVRQYDRTGEMLKLAERWTEWEGAPLAEPLKIESVELVRQVRFDDSWPAQVKQAQAALLKLGADAGRLAVKQVLAVWDGSVDDARAILNDDEVGSAREGESSRWLGNHPDDV